MSRQSLSTDPIHIHPFGGYYSTQVLYAMGRVLHDQLVVYKSPLSPAKALLKSLRVLSTDELEGIKVTIKVGEIYYSTVTDAEGYYIFYLQNHGIPLVKLRQQLEITMTPPQWYQGAQPADVRTQLYTIDSAGPHIITDIDDTILQSHVTSPIKMLWYSLALSPSRRTIIGGAGDFLRSAVQAGAQVFYVSNSPYNLYRYLTTIWNHHNLPYGPILLRDIGRHILLKRPLTSSSKYQHIVRILDTYPARSFVLVGDAAESDVRIYQKVALQYAAQVKAILIRAVGSRSHDEYARQQAQAISSGTPILFFQQYEEAKSFVSEQGWWR